MHGVVDHAHHTVEEDPVVALARSVGDDGPDVATTLEQDGAWRRTGSGQSSSIRWIGAERIAVSASFASTPISRRLAASIRVVMHYQRGARPPCCSGGGQSFSASEPLGHPARGHLKNLPRGREGRRVGQVHPGQVVDGAAGPEHGRGRIDPLARAVTPDDLHAE